jgi:hypothetical protein
MSHLLDTVIAAHGGMERWQALRSLSAHISIGGALWRLKGWPDAYADARVDIATHCQRAEYTPLRGPGPHTLFQTDRVAVIAGDGRAREERRAPRSAFAGHGLATPWDSLHLAYFSGYAMWNYLTMPFLLRQPGVQAEEVESWDEGGTPWRRLRVIFPDELHTHSREQLFYFDSEGLLRRHDYQVDVIGSGSTSAHLVSGHRDFGGIVFPTVRRVYPVGPDNKPLTGTVLVSIDVHEVELI